jgi:hypothetical protein
LAVRGPPRLALGVCLSEEVTFVGNKRRTAMVRTTGALVAGVVIAALATTGSVTAQNLTLKAVRDPQNRFSIDVPASWIVTVQTRNPSVEAKSPAPKTSALPDSLDVTVYDWRVPISAQDCISESDLVLRYVIHTWTTVNEGPATIGGQPAYSRVYNWKAGNGEPRQSVETCVTHGSRVYVAVGTTENTAAKINTTMPVLQRAIATLQPNVANVPSETPPVKPGGGKN